MGVLFRASVFCCVVGVVGVLSAEDNSPAPAANAIMCSHLVQALDALNATTNDLEFARDVAEPVLALPVTRRVLRKPLALIELRDAVLSGVQGTELAPLWLLADDWLALDDNGSDAMVIAPSVHEQWKELPPELAPFAAAAAAAAGQIRLSFSGLETNEMRYAACGVLGDTFNVEDDHTTRMALISHGFTEMLIDRYIADGWLIDPEPGATNALDVIRRVDTRSLLSAGLTLEAAARRCLDMDMRWPDKPVAFDTEGGRIWVGSTNDDVYADGALLILDPGGNDTYEGAAGVADGLYGTVIAVVVDAGGNDVYLGQSLLGAGSALFGVAVVIDAGGRDRYESAYAGQGVGLYGVALLHDLGDAHDQYRAQALGQGAGYCGFGLLADQGGNDDYDLGFYGQGLGGVRGVGILLDRTGDDRYFAGRVRHDWDRHDDRYISLAQGFAIGMRPFGGGGVGVLVDLEGHDDYAADVYGQGSAYWYAVGMLIDVAGEDNYSVYHYGQGSGIHLASGLLSDGGGDDRYSGYILTQGNAHDYAVGMLLDSGGNDAYAADHHAQGRAIFNSVALLVDSSGDDVYMTRQDGAGQGVGHDGDTREYGSMALLLDLEGRDQYSSGATNRMLRFGPYYGLVYDVEPMEAATDE